MYQQVAPTEIYGKKKKSKKSFIHIVLVFAFLLLTFSCLHHCHCILQPVLDIFIPSFIQPVLAIHPSSFLLLSLLLPLLLSPFCYSTISSYLFFLFFSSSPPPPPLSLSLSEHAMFCVEILMYNVSLTHSCLYVYK